MKSKTQAVKSIDEYIATFPKKVQTMLKSLRSVTRKAAPDATEDIKYQMPTFVYGGNLVHFAAYQNHIGFYPTPSAIEQFQDQLTDYKFAKGSIQFPIDSPLPLKLIEQMVLFRVKENAPKVKKAVKKKESKIVQSNSVGTVRSRTNSVKKKS